MIAWETIHAKTFTETQIPATQKHRQDSTEKIRVNKLELVRATERLCEEEEWGSDTRAAEFVLNGTQESVVEREVV